MSLLASTWGWLLSPLDATTSHALSSAHVWHARCMVLAWGILLPVGALAARYFKVTAHQQWPQQLDSQAWWMTHRTTQWLGVVLATLGVWMVWGHASSASGLAKYHRTMGWSVMLIGWIQIFLGYTRGTKGGPTDQSMRGDHYDMTPHRVWFERLHKSLGWLSVLAALWVIASGLWVANAPRWMPITLGIWWALLIGLSMRWQRQGRCIDTYQAIWGPDPWHPGNRQRPIGWGVCRPDISSVLHSAEDRQ